MKTPVPSCLSGASRNSAVSGVTAAMTVVTLWLESSSRAEWVTAASRPNSIMPSLSGVKGVFLAWSQIAPPLRLSLLASMDTPSLSLVSRGYIVGEQNGVGIRGVEIGCPRFASYVDRDFGLRVARNIGA